MAEIVAGFAGAAIEVVKWAAKPILRQFNYLCCFASNIDGLKHEAEELDLATRGLQDQVERERENVRVIVPQVESWLTKSNEIKGQKDTILDEVPNVKSGFFKIGARFALSKRAKKAIDRMKELRSQKNFNPISVEGPPAATQETPLGRVYEFESRKKIEQDIIATLRGGDMNMIGICGMGGLGKTTMAQRIMNRVLKEQAFKEVVMVVVSQQVDKSSIQVEIGKSLGLHLQHDSSQARVQKLHARLTGMKRILLVLDDVWEGLELESLGIPRCSNGCKVLVTSRNKDALSEMDVQKIFGMEVLTPKDAWFLFRERAGTCVDDAKLNPIAKDVVDECGGLPIALTTVGAALKDESDLSVWKDALRQLREYDPIFIEKVYNPLRLSYDFLRSQQAKSLLLLCCLLREDAQIPLEQLTYFCMGLGIFESTMNLERSRNKVRSLAKMLKSRSLLLDGSKEDRVKMHDVVRDVCKIIAKQEGYIGDNDCAWISSSEPEMIGERSEFPMGLRLPNIRLLLLTSCSELKFESVFLEGIKDLHVLWIEDSTLTSLPHGRQPLGNLKTFVLDSCEGLKTISVVGELVNLEILICRYCDSLEELPQEIKGLNRLKLLELTGCYKLQSIGRGIISSLVGLEELKMLRSFNKWEAEDREGKKNAGLREIEALINLTCLEIEIKDAALVTENMQISAKLQRFHIAFHTSVSPSQEFNSYDRKMNLWLEREMRLGHWIEMQLLKGTQSLILRGNGARSVDLRSQNIKWLMLRECETMKNIVTSSSYDDIVDATVFPASLEYMYLYSLPQLQEISCTSFQNLTSIIINDCPRLPNLAKLSIAAKDCLSQLEELSIERCETIEQVFLWKEEEEDNNGESRVNPQVKFPKLKEVWLGSLPNLATFCQGIGGIEFPLLRIICVEKCPKWTSMVSCSNNSSNEDIHDEYSSHLFCQLHQASFGNLRELMLDVNPFCGQEIPVPSSYSGLTELRISNYHGSRSLFSPTIATNLVNLITLWIEDCDEIVQVIKDDDGDEEEKTSNVLADANGGKTAAALFPKLEELSLENLPKLVSFCEWKRDVVLPSMRKVEVMRCPKMKKLSSGFVAAPNLEGFLTDLSHYLELGVNFSFDRLKTLWIENLKNIEYPFYDHKFFVSLIDGVEDLRLYGHQSKSLFSSSIAGKLVNLRSLWISRCVEMVKVIEEEEEDEEVGRGRATLLFPKLEELGLENLSKLVSFCEVKCVVALPSLRKVCIAGCPIMERFSLGPLTTPNLESIKIEHKDISCDQRDLNGALQQHYSNRAKERKEEEEKKKKEEEEGGKEEQRSKGEIEEDQSSCLDLH